MLMSRTLSSNSSNDLFLGKDGNISVSIDLQSILEVCAHVMKTRLGEIVLNTDLGIPYFEVVWIGVPNLAQFEASSRRAILQVEGTLEITSFITDLANSVLTYTVTIKTIYGTGEISNG